MTDAENLTVEILKQIRDGVDRTRAELVAAIGHTNERIDVTNERLDVTNSRLERLESRQTAMELRLATEIVAVAKAIQEVRELLREQVGKQLSELTGRVAVLEHWRQDELQRSSHPNP